MQWFRHPMACRRAGSAYSPYPARSNRSRSCLHPLAGGAKAAPAAKHELVLTRLIDAPRDKLFRCWTEPELLKQWFAPLPYTVPHAELDVRKIGRAHV